MLAGMMARPRAISSRTNSGVTKSGMAAPKLSPSRFIAFAQLLAAEVFADGDEFHLRRDDAGAGIGELRDGAAAGGAQRGVADREFRRQPVGGNEAVVLRLDGAAVVTLDVAARR